MYSVAAYGKMIADTPRMEAYVSALRQAVRPGAIVLDLGCGPGLFALLACRFEARRIYAVEPDDVIQLARETASVNGCSDRIEFLQNFSTQISLPEQVDVIVSDLRGVLPWFQQHLPSICDARRRLLAPGGTLIPRRDTLWASVAEAPDHYAKIVDPWETNGWRLDLSAVRRVVTNTCSKGHILPDQMLVEPVCWAELDYYTVEEPDVQASIEWVVTRPGTAHVLSVWFDSELIEGVRLSNRPGEPELIYGNALFPFAEPVEVAAGDRIAINLAANLVGDDYVWRWHTRIFAADTKHIKADFKQSTFFGTPLSREQLHKRAANFVPSLNEDGQVHALILKLMDGQTTLEEIAARVSDRFPVRLGDREKALGKVGEVSQRFSQ
ncbi:MAG TPA: 50S ribosomal protein L11 methyltransferase [Pyrinomonadaceae bacterium]|nr:50S ribosomal protein L11 methyltransferase [Pyrinomonadaceae bacterium]